MSMGGQITLLTIEKHGARYNGALPLCGANEPEFELLSTIFENRVLFDYYFPDVLPAPDRVPPSLRATREFAGSVLAKVKDNRAGLDAMRSRLGFRDDREVVSYAVLTTEIIGDVQRRAGGNPFDNRAVLYDDPAVQKGVKRYAADEKARAWLAARQQLTGKVTRPVLALQKTNDGLVTSAMTNAYPGLAAQNGSANLFVQQYVEGTGHCTFAPEQIGAAFDALREWQNSGKQPPVGLVGGGSGARR
jgi:pimeloyl-ACP methyl ester carboxylesterase